MMIYFDNAATTMIDEDVLKSFLGAQKLAIGNASSTHQLGYAALEFEKKAKKQIASFFNCNEEDVIFTSGATESNNLAIKGVIERYKNRGKHIITSKIEHLSVLNSIKELEEKGFIVTYIDVDKNGVIDLNQLIDAMRDDTILVSIMTVNNETGAIQPIEEIARIIKKYPNAHFHTDATQSIGKINIDYSNVDLITFSGHKINSFKGMGALIKRNGTDLVHQISGGGHQNGYRSGTTNVPGEIALAKSLRIAFESQHDNYVKVRKLYDHMIHRLNLIQGIDVHCKNGSPFIISFEVPKKASVVAEALSNREIYVSTKSACSSKKQSSSYVLEAMGLTSWACSNSIRVSFCKNNTIEEVNIFCDTLIEILNSIK